MLTILVSHVNPVDVLNLRETFRTLVLKSVGYRRSHKFLPRKESTLSLMSITSFW